MDDLLKMDGFNDCIAGVVERYGQEPIICYDLNKVLDRLKNDGMSEEEANEYFLFNQLGAWVGDQTPCFITKAEEYMDGDNSDPDQITEEAIEARNDEWARHQTAIDEQFYGK